MRILVQLSSCNDYNFCLCPFVTMVVMRQIGKKDSELALPIAKNNYPMQGLQILARMIASAHLKRQRRKSEERDSQKEHTSNSSTGD